MDDKPRFNWDDWDAPQTLPMTYNSDKLPLFTLQTTRDYKHRQDEALTQVRYAALDAIRRKYERAHGYPPTITKYPPTPGRHTWIRDIPNADDPSEVARQQRADASQAMMGLAREQGEMDPQLGDKEKALWDYIRTIKHGGY